MSVSCPECEVSLSRSDIIAGLAKCPACDHVWKVEPPKRKGKKGRIQLPLAPEGVRPKVLPDRVVQLRMPWAHEAGLAIHVLWLLVFAAFLPVLNGEMPGPIEMFFGGSFFFVWLYNVANTTTVFISRKGVEIQHGPFPSIQDRYVFLAANEVRRLFIVESHSYYRGTRRATFHSLKSGNTTLLRQWRSHHKVEYVQQCIEQIVERPGSHLPPVL